MGAQIYESIEAQQEANKVNKEYEEKGKKYEKNPDLAKEERKKANEIFTSKKSPEELKKYKLIIEEVKKLKKDESNLGKTQDEIYEMAEKIVEENLKNNNTNTEKKEIDPLKTWNEYTNKPSDNPEDDNYKFPESIESTTKETSKTVGDILDNHKEKQDPENKESQEAQKNAIKEKYEKIGEGNINNPEYSVLKNLTNSEEISPETKEIIEITIETNGEFNKDFEESIENKDDLKKIQELLKQIPKDKETIPTNNLSNFKEDFPDLFDISLNGIESKELKKNPLFQEKKSKIKDKYKILAYEYIGENYIKIEGDKNDSEKNKKDNFSTAIKTASANIIRNDTTLHKDKDDFKQAVIDIHSGYKDKQFLGLSKLIEIKEKDRTDNAAKGKKLEKKLNLKLKKLEKEAITLEQNKNNTENHKTRKKEIKEEYDKINKLLGNNKVEGGEIIGGGDKIEQNETGVESKTTGV